jgi:hypothetical protein
MSLHVGVRGKPMGIKWAVSHPQRLITAVGEVSVTATDILRCIDEFAKTGISIYRKLFDLTQLTSAITQADLRLVAARLASNTFGHAFGPTAIVVVSEALAETARIFQAMTATNQQVQIFRDPYVARVWLDVTTPADQIPEIAAKQASNHAPKLH